MPALRLCVLAFLFAVLAGCDTSDTAVPAATLDVEVTAFEAQVPVVVADTAWRVPGAVRRAGVETELVGFAGNTIRFEPPERAPDAVVLAVALPEGGAPFYMPVSYFFGEVNYAFPAAFAGASVPMGALLLEGFEPPAAGLPYALLQIDTTGVDPRGEGSLGLGPDRGVVPRAQMLHLPGGGTADAYRVRVAGENLPEGWQPILLFRDEVATSRFWNAVTLAPIAEGPGAFEGTVDGDPQTLYVFVVAME